MLDTMDSNTNMIMRPKRKAPDLSAHPMKKARLETTSAEVSPHHSNEEDVYDEHANATQDEESDEDAYLEPRSRTNTPATPFSPPPRAKYPSQLKTLRCTVEGCDKTFNRPSRLEDHLRAHNNERPFVCTYEGCDKAYIQEKHLKTHIKGSHLHEKSYACDWEGCTKSYLTGQRLRRHIAAAHEGEGRFNCTGYAPCTESFRKRHTLERHIRSVHLNLREYQCTHVDPETGVTCGLEFDAPGSLRNHIDREHNEPRYACDECMGDIDEDGNPQKLKFSTKALLTKHINEEHMTCLICHLKCANQRSLQDHIEARHSGASLEERRKLHCTYPGCSKSFTKQSNLNAHIRAIHEKRKFVCGQTDLQLTTAGAWGGEGACGDQFSSKANLADHVRTQHMGLPSTINANRAKARGAGKKKNTQETSTIDELTGRAYQEHQGRDIDCAVMGCSYKFMRSYDHLIHLQSHHMMTRQQAENRISGEGDAGMRGPTEEEILQEARDRFRYEVAATSASEFSQPRARVAPHPAASSFQSRAELVAQPAASSLQSSDQVMPYSATGSFQPNDQLASHSADSFFQPSDQFAPYATVNAFAQFDEIQLQRQAAEGGAFWLGAEYAQNGGNLDGWEYEQREMQELIGPTPENFVDGFENEGMDMDGLIAPAPTPENGNDESFWDNLDPSLR